MRTRRSEAFPLEALDMGPKRQTNPRPKKIPVLDNPSDQTASRLLSLTPELRNNIYEFCFSEIRIVPYAIRGVDKGEMKAPGLLLACKQLYAEGLKIYYNRTAFHCIGHARVIQFLRRAITGGHGADLTCVALSFSRQERFMQKGYRKVNIKWLALKEFERLMAALKKDKIVARVIQPGTMVIRYREAKNGSWDMVPFETWTIEEVKEKLANHVYQCVSAISTTAEVAMSLCGDQRWRWRWGSWHAKVTPGSKAIDTIHNSSYLSIAPSVGWWLTHDSLSRRLI